MGRVSKFLAASIGGGIVLGIGIRLGDALADRRAAPAPVIESVSPEEISALKSLIEEQRAELAEVARRVEATTRTVTPDIENWVQAELDRHSDAVELAVRGQLEATRDEAIDAVATAVQRRVVPRIAELEDEVSGQSIAISELRDHSQQTDRAMQRVLAGLERLIASQSGQEGKVAA